MMGAPTVMTEKLPQGEEIVIALRKLEKFMGRKVDGLLCGEAGGINSTTPFVAAAATGLPLIDGDGMGRAFPELQMTTFGMYGVSATPMALGDDKGNSRHPGDHQQPLDRAARALLHGRHGRLGAAGVLSHERREGQGRRPCAAR